MRYGFNLLVLLIILSPAVAQEIKNPDFSLWQEGKPVDWLVRSHSQEIRQLTEDIGGQIETALEVELVSDGGSRQGEILQKIVLDAGFRYQISGTIRSTKNGIGFIQVKTFINKKETSRVKSDRSKAEWKNVEIEVDSSLAEEIQVLCRFSQKSNLIGEKIWWKNIKITRTPTGEEGVDPSHLNAVAPSRDYFISADGEGDAAGSSWDDAYPVSKLQDAIIAAGPGHTVYIGSGDYHDVKLDVTAGGLDGEQPLSLIGIDTGGGFPRFHSNFTRKNPSKSGGSFITIGRHVGFVTVRNLNLRGYNRGFVLNGPNRGVHISDIHITECREGFSVNGDATPFEYTSGTRDLLIQNCSITNYTKRGIRIRGGVYDSEISHCHADSGGKLWAVESFPMGFSVEGSKTDGIKDYNITFRDSTASNNWQIKDRAYWNGDGFCAERNTENLQYINCGAFGNTDGGWDLKTVNPVLINCVSFDNKRNYRFWSAGETPAELINCISGYTNHRGGTGNVNGVHVAPGGGVKIDRMTFIATETGIDLDSKDGRVASAEISNSLFYLPNGTEAMVGEGCNYVSKDNIVIDLNQTSADPKFIYPHCDWRGGSDAFNSQVYLDYGYRYDVEP